MEGKDRPRRDHVVASFGNWCGRLEVGYRSEARAQGAGAGPSAGEGCEGESRSDTCRHIGDQSLPL